MHNVIWWVDRLDVSAVLNLFVLHITKKYRVRQIRHFGKASLPATWLARLFLVKSNDQPIVPADFDLALPDRQDGEALFWHVWREAFIFGREAIVQSDAKSFFIGSVNGYDSSVLRLYAERQVAYEQKRNLSILRIVDWHLSRGPSEDKDKNRVLLNTKVWEKHLKGYASGRGIHADCYESTHYYLWIIIRLALILTQSLKDLVIFLLKSLSGKDMVASHTPNVGVFYAQGASSERRSDLYWLEASGIDPKNIIVYFLDPSKRPTRQRIDSLQALGVRWVSLLSWRLNDARPAEDNPRRYFWEGRYLLDVFFSLVKLLPRLWRHHRLMSWEYERLIWLLHRTAVFEALFRSHGIVLHFGLFSEDDQNIIAVHLALKRVKGADVYTHWSNHPEAQIMPAHDVYFSWGPYYRQFYEKFGHGMKNIVYVGYPFDSIFALAKQKAQNYRRELTQGGAKFVLCFFDNAYWEGTWFTQENLVAFHERLLTEVKSNSQWAIILKPKRLKSLQSVLKKGVPVLIEELTRKKRCLVLTGGELPAEAALAADLSIGYGAFNSAAAESALAGIPTVTFDPSRQRSHPFYKKGFEKIVFDDMDRLFDAVKNYAGSRLGPQSGFADYSYILNEIDPFRDLKASDRIGRYIGRVFDELSDGRSAEQALKEVNAWYEQQFGDDKVVSFEGGLRNQNLSGEKIATSIG